MWTGFQTKLLVILAVFNVQLVFFSCGFLFPIKHLEELIKLGDDMKVESVFQLKKKLIRNTSREKGKQ